MAKARWIATGAALVMALLWALPLLWALSSSFEGSTVNGNQLVPSEPTTANWGMLVDPGGRAVNILVRPCSP
jgi:ABC-type glycerol-3-phosphate transport system permease component